jgi:hypothetical protein
VAGALLGMLMVAAFAPAEVGHILALKVHDCPTGMFTAGAHVPVPPKVNSEPLGPVKEATARTRELVPELVTVVA